LNSEKVNYETDDIWNQWSVAAKLQILMKPSPMPPMGQCHMQHSKPNGVAAAISSLSQRHDAMLEDPNVAQTGIDSLKTPLLTSPNKISGAPRSNADSEATQELFTFAELNERNKKSGFSFESSTWGPAANEANAPAAEERGNKSEVG
jgi:hypothetical protein